MIDYNSLTMGEIAKIEELSGQPFTALEDDSLPKGNALAALAFVVKRREEKGFTWNQAQELTLTDVTDLLGLDVEAEPEDDDDPKDSD